MSSIYQVECSPGSRLEPVGCVVHQQTRGAGRCFYGPLHVLGRSGKDLGLPWTPQYSQVLTLIYTGTEWSQNNRSLHPRGQPTLPSLLPRPVLIKQAITSECDIEVIQNKGYSRTQTLLRKSRRGLAICNTLPCPSTLHSASQSGCSIQIHHVNWECAKSSVKQCHGVSWQASGLLMKQCYHGVSWQGFWWNGASVVSVDKALDVARGRMGGDELLLK